MALDLFAVVAPGQARCRRPDARGLADLARLGMRVAIAVGGDAERARADMDAFGGPVVHVTEPLVAPRPSRGGRAEALGVDHDLVQRLVREMISHAASRRPSVVYCDDGVTGTGLLAAALRIALGHDADQVFAERRYFEARARASFLYGPYRDSQEVEKILAAQDAYLAELARLSRPAAAPPHNYMYGPPKGHCDVILALVGPGPNVYCDRPALPGSEPPRCEKHRKI